MTQTVSKMSRNAAVRLAKDLGVPFPSSESNKLIDEALRADDPEAFLRGRTGQPPAQAADHIVDVGKMVATLEPEIVDLSDDTDQGPTIIGPSVTIDVPLGEPSATGHARRFVSISLNLDRDQAATFQRMYYGLYNRSTRLASGRHVENQADVVRWLIEQAGQGAGGR